MPIYEYQCQACGNHTELLQKISEPPATQCPHCQQPTLQKKISATSFQLKGNGWYVTDFRGKKEKNTPSKETAAEATPTNTTTKTESNTTAE